MADFNKLDESIKEFVFSLKQTEKYTLTTTTLSSAFTELLNLAEVQGIALPQNLEELAAFLRQFPEQTTALYFLGMMSDEQEDRYYYLEAAADRGNDLATFELAINHEAQIQRIAFCRNAISRGHTAWNYQLGLEYKSKLPTQAKSCFLKAYQHGHVEAAYQLAVMLKTENNPDDQETVFELFKFAADNGHAEAMHHTAIAYETGFGAVQNHAQAITYMQASADQGFLPAQSYLALAFRSPAENFPRYDLAFKYACMAAEGGDKTAQHWLGEKYIEGWEDVIEPDFQKAQHWLMRSGGVFSTFALARCYKNAFATEQNLPVAFKYYGIAADMNHEKAMQTFVRLALRGHGTAFDTTRVAKYLNTLAYVGAINRVSKYIVPYACLLLLGRGILTNADLAFRFFGNAVLVDKNPIALFQLSKMYLRGDCIAVDAGMSDVCLQEFNSIIKDSNFKKVEIIQNYLIPVEVRAEIVKYWIFKINLNQEIKKLEAQITDVEFFMGEFTKIFQQMLANATSPGEVVKICRSVPYLHTAPQCYFDANMIAAFSVYDTVLQMTGDPVQAWSDAKKYFENIFNHCLAMQMSDGQRNMFLAMMCRAEGVKYQPDTVEPLCEMLFSDIPQTDDPWLIQKWQNHFFSKLELLMQALPTQQIQALERLVFPKLLLPEAAIVINYAHFTARTVSIMMKARALQTCLSAGDLSQYLLHLQAYAEAQQPSHLHQFAVMCEDGVGCVVNTEAALSIRHLDAAVNGHDAQYLKAKALLRYEGENPASVQDVIADLNQAALDGYIYAFYLLGEIYASDKFVSSNIKLALSCYQAAAQLGHAKAQQRYDDLVHDQVPEKFADDESGHAAAMKI